MNIPAIFVITILASLAVGCTSMPTAIDPHAKIDKSKGIILAAVTNDNNPQVMDAWFFYRKKGSDEGLRMDAYGMAGLLSKPNDFQGQEQRTGRLLALPLEPGEYELINWMLYIYQPLGYGYLSPKTPPPPHSFTIDPGTVTYLGNLHIDTMVGTLFLGLPIPVGGNPDIIDRQELDISLMHTKYPNLNGWPVNISVPDRESWKILENEPFNQSSYMNYSQIR